MPDTSPQLRIPETDALGGSSKSRPELHVFPLVPGLFDTVGAAGFLSTSRSNLDRWNAAGLCPAPVRPGGPDSKPFWSSEELSAWCRHGCPPRAQWAMIWERIRQPELKRIG